MAVLLLCELCDATPWLRDGGAGRRPYHRRGRRAIAAIPSAAGRAARRGVTRPSRLSVV